MVFENDKDFLERKDNRTRAMCQVCENLDIMKLVAVHSGDLRQLHAITTSIDKYCSEKCLPEPKDKKCLR